MSDADHGKPLEGFVARLTAMSADDDALDTYEAWAPSYEADMLSRYGYSAHRIAAAALARSIPDRDSEIADLGCGTGLVGQALAALGYRAVDGIDAAANMLDEARRKGVYRTLTRADLSDGNALPAAHYHAAIAVGIFGGGHLGPQHLETLLGTVVPGGVFVFYANGIPYAEDDYPSHLLRLEEAGAWTVQLAEKSNYMDGIERPGWLVVTRRAPAPS